MALRVSESKFWDHFSIQTSPQNPQNDTLGTQIGPRKVIFGHFAFFEYFYRIFFEHSLSTGRIFQMQTPSSKSTFFWVKLFFLAYLCIDPVRFSVFCRSDHFSFWGPALLPISKYSFSCPFLLSLFNFLQIFPRCYIPIFDGLVDFASGRTLPTRVRWESKLFKNIPPQLNSYVKLSFKAGLFSSTFRFEHSFIAKSAFLFYGLFIL